MGDKDIIADYQNLYRAYRRAKRNKGYNGSCAKFQTMTLEGLHMLKEQLENQAYCMSPYNKFRIYEPKERVIESCSFKDKIVQHSLSDNILHPRLESEFIRTNYAGQKGKGTDFGRECLKEQMLEFYAQHGLEGWILKCDVRKFFYRIDHETIKDIVDYYFPDEYTRWLNHLFIESTDGLGLPLGNQVAQIYALLMLDGMDHMVTGELGIRLYGRYMDDFYLIHHDKEYLGFCLENINEMTSSLNLELNEKTQIVPFKCGMKFLGFHHYVTREGKYIRKLPSEKKRRAVKRVRKLIKKVKKGEIDVEKFYHDYNAWKNHALKGNCIKLCNSMDLYVEKELNHRSGEQGCALFE
ncbi:MAG: RNA-directed DNA polymerase [Lachnospiraceae bacterium]|nr:RNA-directed DNA polymerase [Lachnospiraceae bacterium]